MRLLLFVIATSLCAQTVLAAISFEELGGEPYNVSWNDRGIVIAGEPTLLLSGDIHYARAFPTDQTRALSMLKADGLNTVQSYVFWNLHEPSPGMYEWGEADGGSPTSNISAFLTKAAAAGLFVSLRIGPFVCGEWSYGGIPAWINQVSGVAIRQHNAAWEAAMTKFVHELWPIVEPFLAKNGGPIVLLQLENEDGAADPQSAYVQYVAELARSLNSQLPFLWCEGSGSVLYNFTGPAPLVPAFNGDDCARDADAISESRPQYPLLWTENEGWYHPWGSDPIDQGVGKAFAAQPLGGENPNRAPEELSFAVARWVARGGALMNYYMYYGGQHFKTSAAAGVMNSYADGVNIHADLLPNEPKRSHMATLHKLLTLHADAIMSTKRPVPRFALPHRDRGTGKWVSSTPGATAFLFGPSLSFLEYSSSGIATAPVAAVCNASSFPIDASKRRYKGLSAGPDTASERECAEACCNLGARCTLYQWYPMHDQTRTTRCWLGQPGSVWTAAPVGCSSRSRTPLPGSGVTVEFRGKEYSLALDTVLLIDSKGSVLYSTSNVSSAGEAGMSIRSYTAATDQLDWSCWSELDMFGGAKRVHASRPLEQLVLTKDSTEYLFYRATVSLPAANTTLITIGSRVSNAFSVFWGHDLVGTCDNHAHGLGNVQCTSTLQIPDGVDRDTVANLTLLSTSLGMMSHVYHEMDYKGITGKVTLSGVDITDTAGGWSHSVGLAGEALDAGNGNKSLAWAACPAAEIQPLTWWRTSFSLLQMPSVPHWSVLLDASGMSRGHFYLNGHDLGKYWLIKGPSGSATQQYYQLPRELLNVGLKGNLLVLADELGATDISAVRVVYSTLTDPAATADYLK